MIKLRFSKPNYKVIENCNKVLCTYECDIYNTVNKIVYRHFKVLGEAICHKKDKFDEKTGKMIADSKAKFKAYSIAKSHYSYTYKTLNKELQNILDVIDFYDQMSYLKVSENAHLNFISK